MTQEHTLYQHVKRPEWGYSTIVDIQDDATTFLFDDGTRRKITRAHVHLMQHVVLQGEEGEEVQRKLAKHTQVRSPAAGKRAATKKKAPAKPRQPPATEVG
jgi:hypothetical protein